jgi:putative redox protein
MIPRMAKPPVQATLTWRGNLAFDATAGAQTIGIDSDTVAGVSPMQSLAFALAGCMAVDVVLILTKGRHALTSLEVRFEGTRAEGPPAYFTAVTLHYALATDAPATAVQRAIDLSRETYCSVWHSLRPDIRFDITFEVAPA